MQVIKMMEIEEKLRNSFKAVKRDIMELNNKYDILSDINNNLIELKKEIKEVRNENVKLREELKKLNSNKSTNEKFKRLRKEIGDISVSAEIDKLGRKTDKQINFLKDKFVTKEDISELNSKIDRALVSKNHLRKIDSNIDFLKNNLGKKFDVEELKSHTAKLKAINEKVKPNNKKKGFLSKKFEEVVDILAEDED